MERIKKERTGTTPGNRKPRVAFLLACVLASLCFTPLPSLAWEQDEHMEINRIAYEKFISLYSASEKFRLSPIDTGMRYPGPYTTSASLFASGNTADAVVTAAGLAIPVLGKTMVAAKVLGYSVDFSDYTVESQFHNLRGWVTHGGYSADEPEMYASVRHFYDPTNTDGHPELTDQENLHGFYDYAVSALEWGFTHPDNAFSFMKGLEYYKKAMEIPEDGKPPAAIPASGGDGSFRDLAFTPEHSEHARRFYLGKAFRALGESMHMISDMAMPAHTRNDSHPYFESIETPLKPEMITASSVYSAEPVDLSRTPMQNFITLAQYTNAHFYTDDTIYIPEKGVTPRNGEKNYESPRLSDLKPVKDGNKVTYYQLFSEWPHSVPMIVEQVLQLGAFHKLLQEVSLFSVPPELGPYYCDKLVPLAIKACYRMMYEFFPTLRLSINGTIEELEEEESRLGFTHKVLLSSAMVHEQENDPAWVEARLSIDYSGPGELYRQRKANKEKIADLIYEDGILVGIRTSEKGEEFSSIIGPIVMYVVPENTKAVAPQGFPGELAFERFMIQDGDSLSVTIEAGGRKITGESWVYKQEGAEVWIQPPRIMLYELLEGAQSVEHTFEAVVRPEGDYRFVWDFGDGSPTVETTGKASEARHTYTGAGEYEPFVVLYNKETGEMLSRDRISLTLQPATKETDAPMASGKVFQLKREPEAFTYETIIDPLNMLVWTMREMGSSPFAFTDNVLSFQIPAMSFTITCDNPSLVQTYAKAGIRLPERSIQQNAATITAAFTHSIGIEDSYGYGRVYAVSAAPYILRVDHRSWRKNYPDDPDVTNDVWDLSIDGKIIVYEHGSLTMDILATGSYKSTDQGPFTDKREESRMLKDVPLPFTLELVQAR